MRVRRAAVALLALLLVGCGPALRPATDELARLDQDRLQQLEQHSHWRASGRLSARDERDSGQLRFIWIQSPEMTEVRLMAPLGQGSWRLYVSSDGAVLEDGDGRSDWAPEPETLLRRHMGWSMPVGPLVGWLTGVPGEAATDLVVADNGAPYAFVERGWQVSYRGYVLVDDIALPRRVDVTAGEREARLLVSDWQWLD